jgi:hypothetical protein
MVINVASCRNDVVIVTGKSNSYENENK